MKLTTRTKSPASSRSTSSNLSSKE